MNAALTLVLCGLLVEVVLRLPLGPVLARATRAARRAGWVFRAKAVSDHWKERAMLAYAGALFGASMTLAGLIAMVALAAGALVWGADRVVAGYAAFILGPAGLMLSVAAAGLYAALRRIVGRHAVR